MARGTLGNLVCYRCGELHNRKIGVAKYCKPCAAIVKREYSLEFQRTKGKEYKAANKHKTRDQMLRHRYGISQLEYEDMLSNQGGVCAICSKSEITIDDRTGNLRHLSVDHCHISGKIRAILCAKCNKGIGAFGDDPAILQRAADYLKSHQ